MLFDRPLIASSLILCLQLPLSCLARPADAGAPAPPYEIRLLDGKAWSNEDAKGKVVILNFWASWCVPCREEMPALDRYYRKHHAQGLEMVAISMDEADDLPKARQIMAQFQFQGGWIGKSQVKGFGRIWRIPLTFVIDRQGILRQDDWYTRQGIDELLLEKIVTPLLSTPP